MVEQLWSHREGERSETMGCTDPNLAHQFGHNTIILQAQLGSVCFVPRRWTDGSLSLIMSTIEMRRSHLRGCLDNTATFPHIYDRELPTSWLASYLAPPAPLLQLRAAFLPEEAGRTAFGLIERLPQSTSTTAIHAELGDDWKLQNKKPG